MLLYQFYNNLSLLSSSLALFKKLGIKVDEGKAGDFEYYGSNYLLNENQFFLANAKNIASTKGQNLLVLEDDAYQNIAFSKAQIDENPNLYNAIKSELAKVDLQYLQSTQILRLVDILHSNLDVIKSSVKSDFSDFSVAVLVADSANIEKIAEILEMTKIQINFIEKSEFFALPNKNLALKYSAQIFEDALDAGSDFVLTTSMGNYEIFDNGRKELGKIANRDLGKMPILFLPQLLLLACGIKDESALNFRYHKFQPEFL